MSKHKATGFVINEAELTEKLAKFGWCMDGHHETCIVKFPGYSCSCGCHSGGSVVVEVNDDEEEQTQIF